MSIHEYMVVHADAAAPLCSSLYSISGFCNNPTPLPNPNNPADGWGGINEQCSGLLLKHLRPEEKISGPLPPVHLQHTPSTQALHNADDLTLPSQCFFSLSRQKQQTEKQLLPSGCQNAVGLDSLPSATPHLHLPPPHAQFAQTIGISHFTHVIIESICMFRFL